MRTNRLNPAASVAFLAAVVIGIILVILSRSSLIPPQVGWVGTGLWAVPSIGALVVDRRHTTTSPLITDAMVIGFILLALSWNRGVPPLVGWVGMGILTVALIVGLAAAKKKKLKGDE